MLTVPKKVAHATIWVVLFLMGGLVMYVWDYSYSSAAIVNSNVVVTDVYPTIINHVLYGDNGIGTVTDGATIPWKSGGMNLWLTGYIFDPNGETPHINARAYRSGLTPTCGPSDFTNCLWPTCSVSATALNKVFYYSCGTTLDHSIDTTTANYSSTGPDYTSQNWIFKIGAGRWVCDPPECLFYYYVEDNLDTTSNWEQGDGIGIDIDPSTLNFGAIAINQESGAAGTNIQSWSNLRIDMQLTGIEKGACPNGGTQIPASSFRYGESTWPWSAMTPISTSPTNVTGFNLDKAYVAPKKQLNFKLLFSNRVKAGLCSPVDILFKAIKDY